MQKIFGRLSRNIYISKKSVFLPKFIYLFSYDSHSANAKGYDTTYLMEAQEKYKIYAPILKQNGDEYKNLIHCIEDLQGVKLGMSNSDTNFVMFIVNFMNAMKRIKKVEQLIDISRKLLIFDFKSEFFWKEMVEILLNNKKEIFKNDNNRIGFYYIIWNCPLKDRIISNDFYFFREMEDFLMNLRNRYSQKRQSIAFETKSELSLLINELQVDFKEFVIEFKNEIINTYKNIKMTHNPLFLSNLLFFLYKTEYESFPMKNDEQETVFVAINELCEAIILKDLYLYDSSLQEYEFSEYKSDEIGVKDLLSWKTINNLIFVLKDERFFNEDLVKRVEDAIFRKCETDLPDIQNLTILLNMIGRFQCIDHNLLNRLLEVLLSQINNEGENVFMYFSNTCKTTINLVEGLLIIIKSRMVNPDLLKEVVLKLVGFFNEKKIPLSQFSKDELKNLERLFSFKNISHSTGNLLKEINAEINKI